MNRTTARNLAILFSVVMLVVFLLTDIGSTAYAKTAKPTTLVANAILVANEASVIWFLIGLVFAILIMRGEFHFEDVAASGMMLNQLDDKFVNSQLNNNQLAKKGMSMNLGNVFGIKPNKKEQTLACTACGHPVMMVQGRCEHLNKTPDPRTGILFCTVLNQKGLACGCDTPTAPAPEPVQQTQMQAANANMPPIVALSDEENAILAYLAVNTGVPFAAISANTYITGAPFNVAMASLRGRNLITSTPNGWIATSEGESAYLGTVSQIAAKPESFAPPVHPPGVTYANQGAQMTGMRAQTPQQPPKQTQNAGMGFKTTAAPQNEYDKLINNLTSDLVEGGSRMAGKEEAKEAVPVAKAEAQKPEAMPSVPSVEAPQAAAQVEPAAVVQEQQAQPKRKPGRPRKVDAVGDGGNGAEGVDSGGVQNVSGERHSQVGNSIKSNSSPRKQRGRPPKPKVAVAAPKVSAEPKVESRSEPVNVAPSDSPAVVGF